MQAQECLWLNPQRRPFASVRDRLPLGPADVDAASDRLARWAPFIARAWPETAAAGGLIESPLIAVPRLQAALARDAGRPLPGRVWVKADHALPVSGSIKARGGIHEVLQHAERLATEAGRLRPGDDFAGIDSPAFRDFFGRHRIVVGSTGNLGLSIGLVGARLGFRVTVHMSADARAWKKALLRAQGVQVVEHAGDYGAAVALGRAEALADPAAHFVDDERSTALFLGYAVAGRRVAAQLAEAGVRVDAEHPLCVHLPCGVGGGPGGVVFGLKQVFGDAVHAFFAEPVQSPCVLLGLMTGQHDRISVTDVGLNNRTLADGLAVGRASGLVCTVMAPLLDGALTVRDERLLAQVASAWQAEGLKLEPSATAGFDGPARLLAASDAGLLPADLAPHLARASHLLWTTGGRLVPDDEWRAMAGGASGPDVPHQ